ncbi:MAG: hypothetical protein RIQ93_1381 [Verrucomicrobiota bacterium]|jgi:hypothetical protein
MMAGLGGLQAQEGIYQVGVARIDVTPGYPIRLTGYASRTTESEGVAQRLWAKGLAIATVAGGAPFVLLTVDNCGIPATLRAEVLKRLQPRGVTSERFAIAFSHTHTGPCVTGVLENIFMQEIPAAQKATIDRYTGELTDQLAQIATRALDAMQPARLSWAIGKAGFAANRRTPGGVADQDLPLLAVRSPDGKLRAVLANYACHATTLPGEINQLHGDWPGCAQESIEANHPGLTALIAIGCGAECNPQPRPGLDFARQHGKAVAAEVDRLLTSELKPITGNLTGRARKIMLPFDRHPTRAEWEVKAKNPQAGIAYHARKNLGRLDRGEKLPTHLPYLVQAWSFGDDLAMVFLPGEVVADYSLRLKKEFAGSRLWVNAYSNDAPAYIPSRRVLAIGGYEGAGAMVYYDQPTRFAPEVEELIVAAVHAVMPANFLSRSP